VPGLRAVIFEGNLARNFVPITLTKPTFELVLGCQTILDTLCNRLRIENPDLIVREHLRHLVSSRHPSTRINNFQLDDLVLFVNGLTNVVNPQVQKLLKLRKPFIALSDGIVVLARFPAKQAEKLQIRNGDEIELQLRRFSRGYTKYTLANSSLIKFPWSLVELNSEMLNDQLLHYPVGDLDHGQSAVMGPANLLKIASDVEVGPHVVLDVRNGPIVIGSKAVIQSFSFISGPAYIGEGSVIKSALIRAGTTIMKGGRIGGEVESSIIEEFSNKSHEGFIGHSYLGKWVNLGAMTTTSDLKNTYGNFRASLGNYRVDTGLQKVGCFIGDYAKSSIGSMILGSKKVGVSAHVRGDVFRDVPSFTFQPLGQSEGIVELDLESSLLTQERMMNRRGLSPSREEKEILKIIFGLTKDERRQAGAMPKRI